MFVGIAQRTSRCVYGHETPDGCAAMLLRGRRSRHDNGALFVRN